MQALYLLYGRALWLNLFTKCVERNWKARTMLSSPQYHDDFIALAEKQEGGWFDGVLEDMLTIFPRYITRVCTTQLALYNIPFD